MNYLNELFEETVLLTGQYSNIVSINREG